MSTERSPPPAPPGAALRCVPGLESGDPARAIERLEGGSVNDSWYVESAQGRYVLRVDGPAWRRPGVDRQRERSLHGIVAGAGLAPRVVRWQESPGVQVREYIEGRAWAPADLEDAANLRRLGARLALLHACEPPATRTGAFDPVAIAAAYLEQAHRCGRGPGAERQRRMLALLADRVQRVADAGGAPAIVHGDLTPANLVDGRGLWFIDFEYAQVAAPLYDYGSVLAWCPRLRGRLGPLLADAARPVPERGLLAARDVHALLAWAWRLARSGP